MKTVKLRWKNEFRRKQQRISNCEGNEVFCRRCFSVMHSVKNHFIKIKNACSVQSLHKTVSIDRHKHFTSSGCRNCITLCVLNPIQWVKIEDPHEDGDVDNCIQVEAVNYYRKALHPGCCRSPRSALCFCKTINELNQIQWLEAPRRQGT